MTNTSEVLAELQKALSAAERAHATLEKAKSSLAPLETAAKEADNAVSVLMRQYQGMTGESSGRGGRRGPRKAYHISNENKIAASGKRAFTRAKNAGASDVDAKKARKEAEKALAKKLGV
ncbi:MAG TPA: hypothetical protein VN841_28570 [Bryobacteraceae bacterium]|nr:hypothetical protein [Bryobacteraceae bacterium]